MIKLHSRAKCSCRCKKKQTHLSGSALRPVERRSLLGFAEIWVVRVTAPQLLTWVKRAKLEEENHVLHEAVWFCLTN